MIRNLPNSCGNKTPVTRVIAPGTSKHKRHDPGVVRPKVCFEAGFCEAVVQFSDTCVKSSSFDGAVLQSTYLSTVATTCATFRC